MLVFFGSKDSKVGELLFDGLESLYGEYYKAIFSGYVLLALGIIVGKLHWNSVRIIGILLYSISLATLIAAFTPYSSHGILDFSGIFTDWVGKIPMIVLFAGMFLFSLFLMLRIHYRHVVTAVHSTLPSIQSLRSTVQQMKEEVSSGPKSST